MDAYRDELVGDAASSMDFDATITDSLEVHQYTTKNLGQASADDVARDVVVVAATAAVMELQYVTSDHRYCSANFTANATTY